MSRKLLIFQNVCSIFGNILNDTNCPQIVNTPYSPEKMKEVMSNFFVESFVGNTPTHYYSGVELRTATCDQTDVVRSGFCGTYFVECF